MTAETWLAVLLSVGMCLSCGSSGVDRSGGGSGGSPAMGGGGATSSGGSNVGGVDFPCNDPTGCSRGSADLVLDCADPGGVLTGTPANWTTAVQLSESSLGYSYCRVTNGTLDATLQSPDGTMSVHVGIPNFNGSSQYALRDWSDVNGTFIGYSLGGRGAPQGADSTFSISVGSAPCSECTAEVGPVGAPAGTSGDLVGYWMRITCGQLCSGGPGVSCAVTPPQVKLEAMCAFQ